MPHSSPRPQTNIVHVQKLCSRCRAAAKDGRGNVFNWVKCQRLNEALYTDTKGCRNTSEPRKRIIHCPSYCHKRTPVCRAFVVCLFVKFVGTICFLKQTRPFSNSQALFGDSLHTKESFDYCKWVKQDNRPEPDRWSCFCYSCKHHFTYLKDCTVWVLFVGTAGLPTNTALQLP